MFSGGLISREGTGLPERLGCRRDMWAVEGVGTTVWSPNTES